MPPFITSLLVALAAALAATATGNALEATGAQAPFPPSPPPRWPKFSWDHVPVYIHMCNRTGPFNDTTVQFFTKFAMVTFEKGQGEDTHQPSAYAEDNILAAAKQVKAADPTVQVIAYLNSVLDWEMYRFHDVLLQHPEMWAYQAPDAQGNRLPTRTKGDGSFPQPKDGMLSVNFTTAAGRAFWAQQCINFTNSGVIDGCFSDRANGVPKNLDPAFADAYNAGHTLMHQELQLQLSKSGKGILISNNVLYDQVFGQMMEGFTGNEDSIEALQKCAATGAVCQAHAGYKGAEHSSNCEDITDALAAFLIGAGERSYFGCSRGWYIDTWDHWNAEFDRPLGTPAAAVKQGAVWLRNYTSASGLTTVSFDTTSNKGSIVWAS